MPQRDHDQKGLKVTVPERDGEGEREKWKDRDRDRDAITDERFLLFDGEPRNEGDSS